MILQPPMMGPNRAQMLQQAAQSAAQNVMRRQKLRGMIGKTVGGGGGATMGSPIRAMNMGKPVGTAGGVSRPGGVIGGGQTLAEQLLAAMGSAATPGAFNPHGGGGDFSSLPDPNDPNQSPQTLPNQGIGHGAATAPGYVPPTPPPGTPGYITPPGSTVGSWTPTAPQVAAQTPVGTPGAVGSWAPGGAQVGTAAGSTVGGQGSALASAGSPGAVAGQIPLGGGLFYDPATDSVVGPGAGSGAFKAS